MSFTFRIIIAVVGYSIQGMLLVHYARKYDGKVAGALRNISLIMTGLPLLFRVKDIDWLLIQQCLPIIFVAAILGVMNIFAMYEALRYIPVGVGLTYNQAMNVFTSLILGILFFHETLTQYEGLALVVIVIGSLGLSIMSNKSVDSTVDHIHKKRGMILVI